MFFILGSISIVTYNISLIISIAIFLSFSLTLLPTEINKLENYINKVWKSEKVIRNINETLARNDSKLSNEITELQDTINETINAEENSWIVSMYDYILETKNTNENASFAFYLKWTSNVVLYATQEFELPDFDE